MAYKKATEFELRKLKRLYNKGYDILTISYYLDRQKQFVKRHIKKMEQSNKKRDESEWN